MKVRKIAIIGEFNEDFSPHLATNAAIHHSNMFLGTNIQGSWVATDAIDPDMFNLYSGIWVAPGSPYKDMDKTLWAIQYARENNIPCFGTCGGFQHIIIEYARNILGYKDAAHAEYDPYASNLFISSLTCSLFGREMQLYFKPESNVSKIYGTIEAKENYYCNFGVNPQVLSLFENSSLKIVGADSEGEARVVELPNHKFFVGTLFVPQNRSTELSPHPLVSAFLKACV